MTTIRSYNKRLEALKSERSSFMALWRELSDYHLAYRGRFLTSDRNKGHKRNTKQINNTSRLATRTLASGMMAGITSPARPWFRLGSGDATLDQVASVKQWLHEVQSVMYRVFASSNTYNTLHQIYSELGVFGVGVMGVFEDFDNVIRCKAYTVGSYLLANNGKDEIDTFYREYEISVAQCIKEYGYENCSAEVQRQWDTGNTEAWIKIVHVVEPNDDRDDSTEISRDFAFRSVHYEATRSVTGNMSNSGASGDGTGDKFLRRSGFREFPILPPRWDIVAEDVYATDCPGITAIGDTKSLQLAEKRKYQAIDKLVSPPLQGPATLKDKVNNGVGANDIVWTAAQGQQLSSIYGNYKPEINVIKEEIRDTENRIQRAFYEDLFLMLANTDRRQITAREVAEKHEEKLLMLGPVLERLHTELLNPLIDRTFNILQRNGVLPPPPPELQDRELEVEYVSVLAQAQRLVATGALERLTGFAMQLAQVWPGARHKVDASQTIDDYAEALGVDPKVVRSDDEAEALAAAEAEAAAQQAAMEQGQGLADIAQTASDTEINDENALGTMMRNAGLS